MPRFDSAPHLCHDSRLSTLPRTIATMPESRSSAPSPAVTRLALRIIVIVYIVLGAMYAVGTPPWQVPDEPAHYNYVRHVATYGTLPELRPGDYPAAYLEEIKARRFSPELSIDAIRYESHQPPLYYVVAAMVHRLAVAWALPELITLRAFSVFLGAMALLITHRLVEALGSQSGGIDPVLPLGTVAFAAVLPMHVAMRAAVNNDTLSGLLVTMIAWRLIAMSSADWTPRRAVGIGALLGLALLTKMQSYVAFALVATALVWDLGYTRGWRPAGGWRRAIGLAAIAFGTALLMALSWLLRNADLYGATDLLGLARHDQVVEGQLTTSAYIAEHGWAALGTAFLRTTFQSFWGVFGWMGVPMQPRVYQALGGLSLLAAYGVALFAWRAWWQGAGRASPATSPRPQAGAISPPSAAPCPSSATDASPSVRAVGLVRRPASHQIRGLVLLAMWLGGTLAGYLWWNVSYLQHQGRYLFPAIVPLGLLATVGLREVYRRPPRGLYIVLAVGALALLVDGIIGGDVAWFGIALLATASGGLWAAPRLEARWPGSAIALTYAALAALTLYALPAYIIPYLSP